MTIMKRNEIKARGYDEILKSTKNYYETYSDNYVKFYENWLRGAGAFSNPKYKEGYDIVASTLNKISKRGERVLDVGCGVGVWSTLLAEKGVYVISLDNLLIILQKTAERFKKFKLKSEVSLVLSDGFYLPFRDEACDGVTLNWVLAHIPVPRNVKFMNEICRVVRSGGWLFISDSYWRGQEGGKEQVQTREADGRKYEVYKYYYEPTELEELLEKTFGSIKALRPLQYELICIARKD